MADFLSEEWYAAAQAKLANDGATIDNVADADLRLQFEIAGMPEGKVRPSAIIHEGQVVAVSPAKVAKPHCKVICDAATAESMLAGTLDPNVAYMRGDLKLDGAYARVLYDLRPVLRSERFDALLQALRAG